VRSCTEDMGTVTPWLLLLGLALAALPARAGESVVLPLVIHVVDVVSADFVAQHVARANEIFEPYRVQLVALETKALAVKHAALDNKEDRDALGAYAERGAIDCFFVRSLRDVDDPKEMRRGVHWRSRTHAGKHYVIVSSIAGPNVLAHELGHYFGHPSHSDVAGNLMSYLPGEGLPVLGTKQVAKMQRAIRRYLESGELKQRH
jgi:hypothetical protein